MLLLSAIVVSFSSSNTNRMIVTPSKHGLHESLPQISDDVGLDCIHLASCSIDPCSVPHRYPLSMGCLDDDLLNMKERRLVQCEPLNIHHITTMHVPSLSWSQVRADGNAELALPRSDDFKMKIKCWGNRHSVIALCNQALCTHILYAVDSSALQVAYTLHAPHTRKEAIALLLGE